MGNHSLSCGGLIVLSSTLALGSVACHSDTVSSSNQSIQPVAASPISSPTAAPSFVPSPSPQASNAQKTSDNYEKALDAATSASTITSSAQSRDDWEVIVGRWRDAIKFLKAVPDSSPNKAKAKAKLSEYQRNLANAELQASPPLSKRIQLPNVVLTNQPSFKVPIKYRLGGIPVIEVSFNGKKFEMLFDTGATHTLITPYMASILTLPLVGKGMATTANGEVEFYVGLIKSMQVGSAIAQNVPVGIGAPDLDIGLFGQDFYKGFEVAVKQDVIEFQHRR